MNYSWTFIVIILLSLVYYINKINITESIKDTINLYIFNSVSILFILIGIYYCIFFGLERGLFTTIIIWCLFVVATPIPEAGLLVSIPLKNLLKIDLDITQFFVSLFALSFIFYSYYFFRQSLKHSKSGKILLKIIDFGSFQIFITSIVASITISYLINEVIDNILHNKSIYNIKNLIFFAIFIVLFIIYFIFLKRFI